MELKLPVEVPNTFHAFHLYVVETNRRDELAKFLNSERVGTALHYPSPIHLQPAYLGRIKGSSDLKVTEKLYQGILTLPMYPELTDNEVDCVITAVCKFFRK